MFYKLGFIGCGNMATAIIKGLISSGYIIPDNITVLDTDTEKTKKMLDLNIKVSTDLKALNDFSNIIFLCVKPQNIKEVLENLSKLNTDNKVIVSIAAGVTIDKINSYFKKNQKIIRVMPNVCLMYKEGASALASYNVSNEEFDFVFGIFNSLGLAVKVNEENFDVVTALSGSGPAFCFKFLENLCDQAVALGLDKETALNLAIQTFIGSAKMLKESKFTTEELIKMVSSKGGTTVAGLLALEENNFDKAVHSAIIAAEKRSKELS